MAEHSGAGVIEGESVKRSTRHLTLSLDQLNADAAAFDGFDPDVAVSDRSRLEGVSQFSVAGCRASASKRLKGHDISDRICVKGGFALSCSRPLASD
jgi:hypothetical protein